MQFITESWRKLYQFKSTRPVVYARSWPAERVFIYDLLNTLSGDTLRFQLLASQSPWIEFFSRHVLNPLLEAGYAIKPLDEFSPEAMDRRCVYMRHDIHAEDVPAAAILLALESSLNIGSTNYITWSGGGAGTEHYLSLKKAASPSHRFGFHMSIMDDYFHQLAKVKNITDKMGFVKLVKEFIADKEFPLLDREDHLLEAVGPCHFKVYPDRIEKPTPEILREIINFGRMRFSECLSQLRMCFSNVQTSASHGDLFSSLVGVIYTNKTTFHHQNLGLTSRFLSPKFLNGLGLLWDAEQIMLGYGLPNVCDYDLNFNDFSRRLKQRIRIGHAFSLSIHPSLWERGLMSASQHIEVK